MAKKIPAAPEHLSATSKALWNEIVPSRASSAERLALLTVALEARDRMDEVREAIKAAGLTTTTASTGAVHVHPLLRVEKESRAQFCSAWALLGLEWNNDVDGRA